MTSSQTTRTQQTATEPQALSLGVASTPFGQCVIGWVPDGICSLHFLDELDASIASLPQVQKLVQDLYPDVRAEDDPKQAQALCDSIFKAKNTLDPHIRVALRGTPFQMKVWQALRQIPFGSVISYGELAAQLGHPKAARAVGTAVAANRIGYLIPCHRVVRQNGERGQFRWGASRKVAILEWEARKLAINPAPR